RLGLIVFGSAPYLQAPFTADLNAWMTLLAETEVAMAGPKTRFGDAIGLAIKLFGASTSAHKVLIVVTDGNDTDSRVPPLEAARIAKAHGIRIYAIAIGSLDSFEQEALDLDTLAQIAKITGGQAYLAINQTEMADVYNQIEALEPAKYETITFAPRRDLFAYFFGASILLNAIFFSAMLAWSIMRSARARKAGSHA
ncbi:MAG: VWA domain-containing protein, partial [Parvibaculaceae bacterium]|nr:VWA domain-containing protein [Parvibaculaceae bacterium]